MTPPPTEDAGIRGWVRRRVAKVHAWQPLMPHLWFFWSGDVPFLVALLVIALGDQHHGYRVLMTSLLAVSVVVQARWAANRVRRGERP